MANRLEQLKQLKSEISNVLKNNILDYWVSNTVDIKNGGFIGQINADNSKVQKANKGIILNSRILWSFSLAYKNNPSSEYLKLADRSYNYIVDEFKDEKYGGVIWEVDFLGNPVNKRKQVYAQSFTIYALTEYYKITKNEKALNWAIDIFKLIELHAYDEEFKGYIEAFFEDWSYLEDVRLSEKDANEKKTMNTHLHILESYTNLIRVWPNEELIKKQKELIALFCTNFMTTDGHLNLFFEEDWTLKSKEISFGHDIETAWLLVEAAEVVNDSKLLKQTQKIAIEIADELLREGIDEEGAIINEKERFTNKFDTDRHWWPQAEGMVGFMNAYEITNDEKYITPIINLWKFINKHIIDHKNGEWFWKVDKAGNIFSEDQKVGFWKCPYHNTRACIEMLNRIEKVY